MKNKVAKAANLFSDHSGKFRGLADSTTELSHHLQSRFKILFFLQFCDNRFDLLNGRTYVLVGVHEVDNILFAQVLCNLRLAEKYVFEMLAALMRIHCRGPYDLMGFLASHTALCKLNHDGLTHVESSEEFEIAVNVLGIEPEVLDNAYTKLDDMVCEHACLREDDRFA